MSSSTYLNDFSSKADSLLGPSYPYYKYIKTPTQLDMSDKGSLSQLGKNINGLINYVEILVTGKSKASTTGNPLGNKFFLKTGGKCKDKDTGESVERYIYVDNVPEGNIPLISSGMGVNFSEFKGLIPGTISNLNVLNPYHMIKAFTAGSNPECTPLTMETIDIYNNKSSETHYVTLVDIESMDPCSFSNKSNPVTNSRCNETIKNYYEKDDEELEYEYEIYDYVKNFYLLVICFILIYIITRLKSKIK